MFWRQKVQTIQEDDITEKIKSEIVNQLGSKGVSVSEINMQMDTDNISLSIYINSSKRLA